MTTPRPNTGGPQRGAQPMGGPDDGRKKKPWWLLAPVAVITTQAAHIEVPQGGVTLSAP